MKIDWVTVLAWIGAGIIVVMTWMFALYVVWGWI